MLIVTRFLDFFYLPTLLGESSRNWTDRKGNVVMLRVYCSHFFQTPYLLTNNHV